MTPMTVSTGLRETSSRMMPVSDRSVMARKFQRTPILSLSQPNSSFAAVMPRLRELRYKDAAAAV